MPYLSHPYENSFKELCASMPLFYLDVYEMREILKVQGRLADELRASTERVISNEFILLADEQTITLWEGMLHITYDTPMTLEQRRNAILGYIYGYDHIGEPEIREIISLYSDKAVTVSFSRGIITITIDEEVIGEGPLLDTLLRRIPAHLRLKIILRVRRVFRHTIPIVQGGAIGAGIIATPVGQDRESTENIRVNFGVFAEASFTPKPIGRDRTEREEWIVHHGSREEAVFVPPLVGQDRTEREEKPIRTDAFLRPGITPTPVGQDRVERGDFEIMHSGIAEADFIPTLVGQDRTVREEKPIHTSAFLHPEISPVPVGQDRVEFGSLEIMHSGIAETDFIPDFAGQDRTGHEEKPIRTDAFLRPGITPTPAGQDRIERESFGIQHSGMAEVDFVGSPVGADRAGHEVKPVHSGTLARPELTTPPVVEDRESQRTVTATHAAADVPLVKGHRDRQEGASGTIYRTHIKPKRID